MGPRQNPTPADFWQTGACRVPPRPPRVHSRRLAATPALIANPARRPRIPRVAGCHPDTTTGPRAVLGSQRPPARTNAQANSTLVPRSDALRAEDGSRSVPFGHSHPLGGSDETRPRSPGTKPDGEKTPYRAHYFPCLPCAMREQQSLRSRQPAAARSPVSPSQFGIPIAWHEGAVQTIKIRRQHIESATQSPFIFMKPGYSNGWDLQHGLGFLVRMVFASTPGRRAA